MGALRFVLNMLQHLETIRLLSAGSSVQTKGLSDEVIQRFCDTDPKLVQAISEAVEIFEQLVDEVGSEFLSKDEDQLIESLQSELINFLLMCRENQLDPSTIKGSYAGALGKPQFISSSYRHYAVDFDSDGKIDLWNSNFDVIGSVANYFKKNGWQSYDSIMTPISYSKSNLSNVEKASKETYKPSTKYSQYKKDFILSDISINPDIYLSVIGRKEPNGKEYSFGHKNFYVITRYNRSRLYALAVYYLSEEIKAAKSKI